jgi:hypothetical protein
MGENLTCLGKAAVAAWFLAACLSGAALAQDASSKRDTRRGVAGAKGATGAPGAILQFEEAPSTAIVYLQESGGMMNPTSEPLKTAVLGEEAPAPVGAAAPRAAPASAAPTRAAPASGSAPPTRAAPGPAAAPAKLAQRRAGAEAGKP